MARGRHARRTGLLARLRLLLWPTGRARGRHEAELARVRALAEASAATASAALVRAAQAEDRAQLAERQASVAAHQLVGLYAELAGLRSEVAGLREELVWAFAEGRLPSPPEVVDLRDEVSRPA